MATKGKRPVAQGFSEQTKARASAWIDRTFRAQSIYFYRLLGITIFLVLFGLVMVLSASSIDSLKGTNNSFTVFIRQALIAILGLVAMAFASLFPASRFRGWTPTILLGALALQAATLVFGTEINGNRNWINIGGLFSLQPSEFLKVALILHLSSYLVKSQNDFDLSQVWWKALVVPGVGMALVMLGKDLGTVIVMFATVIGLLALAGLPARIGGLIAIATAVLTPLALSGSSSRWGRIVAWLNPSGADPNGYNWQSEHGIWAIAAGGIFGQGLGQSKMKWSWIPEVENDFIFAIIAEELGLIGALAVVGLFIFLMLALVKIYQRTQDQFSRYIVSGVMVWITLQALINIAVVLRLLPVLGVPLPLISAGGSSILATLGAIGIVLAIERENHTQPFSVKRTSVRARAKR